MKVVFYTSDLNGVGLKLQSMLATRISSEDLETYKTITDLARRLRYRSQDIAVAVLFAAQFRDLVGFVGIQDLLTDRRIILILPSNNSHNITLGHQLYPRFIGYADGSLNDIDAVLTNLFGSELKERRTINASQ